MTPGQLSIIAAVHRVANGGEPDATDTPAPSEQGTLGDLMMFSTMTRG